MLFRYSLKTAPCSPDIRFLTNTKKYVQAEAKKHTATARERTDEAMFIKAQAGHDTNGAAKCAPKSETKARKCGDEAMLVKEQTGRDTSGAAKCATKSETKARERATRRRQWEREAAGRGILSPSIALLFSTACSARSLVALRDFLLLCAIPRYSACFLACTAERIRTYKVSTKTATNMTTMASP